MQMHQFLLSVVTATFVFAPSAFADVAQAQRHGMAEFADLCVKHFPDTGRIPAIAKAKKYRMEANGHWFDKVTGTTLFFVPRGEKEARAKRDILWENGTKTELHLRKAPKKAQGGCYVVVNTTPANMYQHLGTALGGLKSGKIKTRARGNTAHVDVEINGVQARIETRPEKIPVGNFPNQTLLSIEAR